MLPLANHLWQSTLFAVAVWVITLALRKNRAAVRHRLWLVASVKFLVPFSLLASLGSQFQWGTPVNTRPAVFRITDTISQPFSASLPSVVPQVSRLPVFLIGVWICGIVVSFVWWFIRWREVRRAVGLAVPSNLDGPLRVMHGPGRFEPGVFGIFRPVLLLPEGITDRLSHEQLQAVLAHELCHVRRRDNLVMAIHMGVEALFWFHPLVWFIKARLLEEQERACDEEVLRLGGDSQVYAESILKICEFYVVSPLTCVSGIAGSNLKKRIEDIMKNRVAHNLGFSRTLLLAVAAIAVLAGPIVTGIRSVEAAPQRGASPASAVQGYRLGEIKVFGATQLNSDTILSSLGLVSGEVYDQSRLGERFAALVKLYGNAGYAECIPEPVLDFDEQRKVVNLTVNIKEGRRFFINHVGFTGNVITPDEVLRREVLVKEGDLFDASRLGLSLQRLNQMGLFEEIRDYDVRVETSPSEPKLDITLRLKEKGR